MSEYNTVSYLILKDGEVLYEQYWQGYSDSSKSNSFSMAKSIVSLLIGAAIDDGFINSVNDPVYKYYDPFDTKENRKLSLKDVLTMSSGLNWDESYGSLFSKTTEAYYGEDLEKIIKNLRVVREPGEEFKYLSGNTQVLAFVLENATGLTLSEYAELKLWNPLGARYDALWSVDNPDGHEKAYCCFNSNARDFARIGQMVLDSGRWNGKQVIPVDYILESTRPADYLTDHKDGDTVDFYGYQWWIIHYRGQAIPYARGLRGQYIAVLRNQNAVVVRLGHDRSNKEVDHHRECTRKYLEAAYSILEEVEE
jgi:CubicO group peptidase (beta-lactamase class C family)